MKTEVCAGKPDTCSVCHKRPGTHVELTTGSFHDNSVVLCDQCVYPQPAANRPTEPTIIPWL